MLQKALQFSYLPANELRLEKSTQRMIFCDWDCKEISLNDLKFPLV